MEYGAEQPQRLTFLTHVVLCLAYTAGAFFAWRAGVPQIVWATDRSMMTSVIAALVAGSAIYMAQKAWWLGSVENTFGPGSTARHTLVGRAFPDNHFAFGHLAQLLSPAIGMFGTAVGLSMQAKELVRGAASFEALSTSLYATAAGVAGFIALAVMTHSLECGIRRAQQ
jgi:hypothetical protein